MTNTYTIDIFNALGFPKAMNKDFNNSNDLKDFTMKDIVEQYKEDLKDYGLKVNLNDHKIVISLCSVDRSFDSFCSSCSFHISAGSSSPTAGLRVRMIKNIKKNINLLKCDKLIITNFLFDSFRWCGKIYSIKQKYSYKEN